ncbi:MAG: DUF3667 domain-containing protein [Bryobacteraceae bacterium]|nr:DUF3667 domain-containing protein [Bryobacteraceae bacterium]
MLSGSYCQGCGEARPDAHEWSWRHFLHHSVHEFTHVDSKIFQTFWLLFRRPGLLTTEYWSGRRTAYIRPLRLYIIAAAVHLLAVSSGFYAVDFIKIGKESPQLDSLVAMVAKSSGMDTAAAGDRLNLQFQRVYGAAQYVAVCFFALVPWLLYRKRHPYYIQHLIFALHVYAFWFLVSSVTGLIFAKRPWLSSPMALITTAYLFFAIRRIYGQRLRTTLWKCVLLRLGHMLAEALAIAAGMGGAILWALVKR